MMELLKRKILLEDSIDRAYNSPTYGQITATSFYVNIIITQNIDDMGMFTDIIYLPDLSGQTTPVDYTILINKLQASGITFPFMFGILPSLSTPFDNDTRYVGAIESDFYKIGGIISANSESRLEDVKTYNNNEQYIQNFDVESEVYTNFSGGSVNGVSRVSMLGDPIVYVFNADKNDPNIGLLNQNNGLVFSDYSGTGITTMSYKSQGWNETNINLSAITKEEYLFGIISKPEVKSDVFIDRGITPVFERHLKLSEVRNLGELVRYGKNYFNVTKY